MNCLPVLLWAQGIDWSCTATMWSEATLQQERFPSLVSSIDDLRQPRALGKDSLPLTTSVMYKNYTFCRSIESSDTQLKACMNNFYNNWTWLKHQAINTAAVKTTVTKKKKQTQTHRVRRQKQQINTRAASSLTHHTSIIFELNDHKWWWLLLRNKPPRAG